MIKYCSNFKCKLWMPLTADAVYAPLGSPETRSTKTTIVGRCTCSGAAAGDCLRCGGV